jgi:hypothetical protein
MIRWGVRGIALAFIAVWAVNFVPRMMAAPGVTDAEAYWLLELGPAMYGEPGRPGAFLYSPVFAQLIAPLTALPFVAFYCLILVANLSALVYLLGPVLAAFALLVPFVNRELQYGNIHLLIGAITVLGLRHSALLAALPLTKVTPGVAMLYHWREPGKLAVSFGTLGAITAVSFLVAPNLWFAWVEMLRQPTEITQLSLWSHTPVIYRLGLAIPLVLLAGWKQRPRAVPLIVLLAIPVPWHVSLCIGLAVLTGEHGERARDRSPATAGLGDGKMDRRPVVGRP